jgi:hypothetical protein
VNSLSRSSRSRRSRGSRAISLFRSLFHSARAAPFAEFRS